MGLIRVITPDAMEDSGGLQDPWKSPKRCVLSPHKIGAPQAELCFFIEKWQIFDLMYVQKSD